MYPYLPKDSFAHYFDDFGIIFTPLESYIINEVEMYMLEKINGKNSIDDIVKEICFELDSTDKENIRNVIFEFIKNKTEFLSLSDTPKPNPIKITGEKGCKIPFFIIASLTNKCILKCIHCYKSCSNENKDFIPYDSFMKTLRFVKGKVMDIQLTGGEPMLHPRFFDILKYCVENFDTTVTTTGIMINSDNVEKFKDVKKIQLSLYSYDREKHESVTGITGSFDKTINAIKELVKINANLSIACMVTRHNTNDMEKMINFLQKLGVKAMNFGSFSPIGRGVNIKNSWLLTDEEYEQVKLTINSLSEKYKNEIDIETWYKGKKRKYIQNKYNCPGCGAGILSWAINEKGDIKPCEFFPDGEYSIANIVSDNIDNIVKNINLKSLPQYMYKWQKNLNKNNTSLKNVCESISDYYESCV